MPLHTIISSSVRVGDRSAVLLELAFGTPAANDAIVREADERMRELMAASGGPLVLIHGPASLPLIAVVTHRVAHLFGAVGVHDPKLAAYVIVVTHDPAYAVGDLIRPLQPAVESQ